MTAVIICSDFGAQENKSFICGILKNDTNELIYKTEVDSQTQNTNLWLPKGIVVLEKTLESPLDFKEIKSVNPKGNQPLIFIERMMLKLKLLYFDLLM